MSEHRTLAPRTSGGGGSCWPGLPTPRARDCKGRGYSDGLPAVVELLPTPRASVSENRQTRRTPSQEAGTHGLNLAAEVCSLLPTPRATDGTKGGPNQRGSSGDLMLPSAVLLLPTPTATDAKSSSGTNPAWGHGTTLTDAARRSTGAPTPPPSTGGPASSDGPRQLQLSLDATDDPA
nr:hypothetical protein [Actinomadura geliboluensis]